MSFIPAWKDEKGNRFVVLARNHVFDSLDELHAWKLSNALYYVPYGWVTDGHLELDLDDGIGALVHVPVKGPLGTSLAVVAGPVFDEANRLEVRS